MDWKNFFMLTWAKGVLASILTIIPQYFLFMAGETAQCIQAPCPSFGWEIVQLWVIPNLILAYLVSCLLLFLVDKIKK